MKEQKTIFKQISDRYYKGEDGRTMRRDEETTTWTLYENNGNPVDTSFWKYEIAERNGIQLKGQRDERRVLLGEDK